MERTYKPFWDWGYKSQQIEHTEETPLLAADGTLLAKGWARRNVFDYDRTKVKTGIMSRKEWDFYQVSNGKYMVQVNFANIHIGGFVGAKIVDIEKGEVIVDTVQYFLGTNKHVPPAKGDVP